MSNKTISKTVSVNTIVEHDGYKCTVTAKALWFVQGEQAEANSVREIDTYIAGQRKDVSLPQFIEATKRDALRELVTQLNLHEVL